MSEFERDWNALPTLPLDLFAVTLSSGNQLLVRAWSYGRDRDGRLSFDTLLGYRPGVNCCMLDLPDAEVQRRAFDGRARPDDMGDVVTAGGISDRSFALNTVVALPTAPLDVFAIELAWLGTILAIGHQFRMEGNRFIFSVDIASTPTARFDLSSIAVDDVADFNGKPKIESWSDAEVSDFLQRWPAADPVDD